MLKILNITSETMEQKLVIYKNSCVQQSCHVYHLFQRRHAFGRLFYSFWAIYIWVAY